MRLIGDRGGAGRLRRCWRPRRHDGPVRTLCRVERLTGAEHREREAMGPVRDGDGGNLAWLASRDELGAVVDEDLI